RSDSALFASRRQRGFAALHDHECRSLKPFKRDPRTESALALSVRILELALGDLLEGHRQVVLRAGLDQRRREVVERPLTELVVVVVDLAGPLGCDEDERIARVDVVDQRVDAWIDHGRDMVAARLSSRSTISASSSAARLRPSFSTT